MSETLCIVMAGGRGSRLGPLTCHRAKPAAPFGGRYRIIDFVLSNFLNSGYRQIYVLTQYMASSLIRHLNRSWHLSGGFNDFIEVAPAQMRAGERWYRGTADAVYQNLNLIHDARVERVAIFSGDHVYKFAIDQMEAAHRESGAVLTIAACPIPKSEASRFGILEVDASGRVVDFQEKPQGEIKTIPGQPTHCLASTGNYFFQSNTLTETLHTLTGEHARGDDFGADIIPHLLAQGAPIFAYSIAENKIPGEPESNAPYWRDVGTLDSYFDAHMDVRASYPNLNLYNRSWRVRSAQRDYPPARFVSDPSRETGAIHDSLVCEGSIISGATLQQSLIGYDCFIHGGSTLREVITMSGCNVGLDARLHRVLMDKNSSIAPGAELGINYQLDRERFPFITPQGVIILPKGTHVPQHGPIELAQDIASLLCADPKLKAALEGLPAGYRVAEGRFRHSYTSAGPRYRRYRGNDPSAFRHGQSPAEEALARASEAPVNGFPER